MINFLQGRGQEFSDITYEIIAYEHALLEQALSVEGILGFRDKAAVNYEILLDLSDADITLQDQVTAEQMAYPHIYNSEQITTRRSLLFGEINEYSLSSIRPAAVDLCRVDFNNGRVQTTKLDLVSADNNIAIAKYVFTRGLGHVPEHLDEEEGITLGNMSIDRLHLVLDGLKKA